KRASRARTSAIRTCRTASSRSAARSSPRASCSTIGSRQHARRELFLDLRADAQLASRGDPLERVFCVVRVVIAGDPTVPRSGGRDEPTPDDAQGFALRAARHHQHAILRARGFALALRAHAVALPYIFT